MKQHFEYVVLGAGVVGTSCAYMLARSGRSVALIEQFQIGHERGSSHGESRITRLSYDNPLYVRMARRVYELWNEVEQDSKQQLFVRTGGIDIGGPSDPRLTACTASLQAEGVDFEMLDHAEMARRFPQFQLSKDANGLYQSETGILSASLCVKTIAEVARRHGGVLFEKTTVRSIEVHGSNVMLKTTAADDSEQEFECNYLVIAAGAWAPDLLSRLGVKLPLTVTLEQWAFFDPLVPDAFMPGKFPIFIQYDGAGSGGIGWYGFPVFGKPGVKTSMHRSGPPTTADTRGFEADQERLNELKLRMRRVLPDAAGKIISTGTCLYTNSSDTHFIMDTLPGNPNIVFFTGCSGHAFKFGPLLGQTLVDMLDRRESSYSLDLFKASRFTAAVRD